MLLNISIIDFAGNAIKETWLSFNIHKFLSKTAGNVLSGVSDFFKKKMNKSIDDLIFRLEGSAKHLNALDEETATRLLTDTKKVLADFDKLDDRLAKKNYLEDSELKQRFALLLKTLFAYELKLHKIVYANAPIIKTDSETIKDMAALSLSTMENISVKYNGI